MIYKLNGQIHISRHSRDDRFTPEELSEIVGGVPDVLTSGGVPGYVLVVNRASNFPVNTRATADGYLTGFIPCESCLKGDVLLAALDLNQDIPRPLSQREKELFTSFLPSFRIWRLRNF